MTSATQDQRLYLPELVQYRRDAARRRAAAFCDVPEYIVGIEVQPITPRTFSMLLATGNRFIVGGNPGEGDVRTYVWFHSAGYSHCGVAGWQKRKANALRPLTMLLTQPWRKWIGIPQSVGRYAAGLALAINDVNALVEEAFADSAARTGNPGAPLATLEAQLVHGFAAEYNWAPERTRNTPLRQLFQLHRCIRAAHGEEVADAGEQDILAAHLRAKNAALNAQREAVAE